VRRPKNSRTEENKIPKSASGPQITHTTNSNNKKLQEQLSPFNTFPTIAEQRPLEGGKKRNLAHSSSSRKKETERQQNRFKRKKKKKENENRMQPTHKESPRGADSPNGQSRK
jgi:hypothetical protein